MNSDDAVPVSEPSSGGGSGRSRLPAWMRWLHTYASMAGLGALLFFALTGLTLNHPDWTFGTRPSTQRFTGKMRVEWLKPGDDAKLVDRLAVVEFLRQTHGVTGLVDDFRVEDDEASLAFKGPAFSADAVIQRKTGAYQLTVTREGWVALVNDLHKGRHTGTGWAWVIDISAGLLALIAASGLWLLLYVRRRRASGLWIGILGAGAVAILYALLVR